MEKLTGKLENITRFDTSRNGNPRYSATIGGQFVYTGVDSSLGYSITNHEGKAVSVQARVIRGKLTIDGKIEVLPAHPDAGYYRAQFARIDTSAEYKATIQVRGPDGLSTNHMNVTADQLRAIEAVMCDPVLPGLKVPA